jgi:hypothetical protein
MVITMTWFDSEPGTLSMAFSTNPPAGQDGYEEPGPLAGSQFDKFDQL